MVFSRRSFFSCFCLLNNISLAFLLSFCFSFWYCIWKINWYINNIIWHERMTHHICRMYFTHSRDIPKENIAVHYCWSLQLKWLLHWNTRRTFCVQSAKWIQVYCLDRQHALWQWALWTGKVSYWHDLASVGWHDIRIKTKNKRHTFNESPRLILL